MNSVSSKIASADRTSSSGVGSTARRSPVCHSSVISSRRRRRRSASSSGVVSGSSSESSSRRIRRSATSSVRRRASVGWAVRTGWTSTVRSRASSPARSVTAASRSTASPRDSSIGRPLRAPRARPQHADALALLREVDELEVEGERAGDGRRAARRPATRSPPRVARARCRGSRTDLRVAAPQRDRPPPDALDRGEQLGSGLLRDDLPQQRAEEPHLVRQRVARATQPGPRRLGRGGRKPGPPRAGRGPSRSGSAVGHGDRMEEARFGCQSATVTVRLQGHRPGTGPQPISVTVDA